jgi:hypothetical protein
MVMIRSGIEVIGAAPVGMGRGEESGADSFSPSEETASGREMGPLSWTFSSDFEASCCGGGGGETHILQMVTMSIDMAKASSARFSINPPQR